MYKHLWLLVILILNVQFVISQSQQQLFTEFCNFIEEQTGNTTFKQNSLSSINKTDDRYFKKVDKLILDSIHTSNGWDSQVIESYTYNDFGNQTSIAQNYATTGTIIKLEFEYDNNANITELRYCLKDSTYQMLTCLLKGEYFYEDEKITHNNLFRQYGETDTSILVSKNTYEYDSKDRIEHIEHLRIDSLGNETLDYHFQYTYEANKITVVQHHFSYFGYDIEYKKIDTYLFTDDYKLKEQLTSYSGYGVEVNSDKISILYNGEDLISEIKIYKWEEDANVWIETANEIMQYDDNAKINEYLFGKYKLIIEYNENHLIAQIIESSLSQDEYIYDEKYEFYYDENGNLTSQIGSKWDTDENDWERQKKTEHKFDLSFTNQNDIILPEYSYSEEFVFVVIGFAFSANAIVYDGYDIYEQSLSTRENLYDLIYENNKFPFWNKKDERIEYRWNKTQNNWEELNTELYFYSKKTIDIQPGSTTLIPVTPNPASTFFNLNLDSFSAPIQLKLYDVSGRLVLEREIYDSENINIGNVNTGLYYIKLFKDDVALEFLGKLLIQ